MKCSEDPENLIIPPLEVNIEKPAEELFFAVQKNKIDVIRSLIEENPGLLTHQYTLYDKQTILILACNDQHSMEKVTKETIQTLIEMGAKCNEPSQNDHWEPIHYASLNANKKKLETIIQYLTKEEINSLVYCSKSILQKYPFCAKKKIKETYSNNALSILLKYGNENNQKFDCCLLLIDKEINIDQFDSDAVTPGDLIWNLKNQNSLKFTKWSKSKSVHEETNQSLCFIKTGNISGLLSLDMTQEEANGLDGKNEESSSCTLLQMCCFKGLTTCVKYLLEKNASPNKFIPKNPNLPIMIAILGNHKNIVKLLLNRSDIQFPGDILLKLQMMYKNLTFADEYMKMVLEVLCKYDKENLQMYLTAQDEWKRTPLHYATYYRCSDNMKIFLQMGASLAEKDIFGNTPLQFMEPHILENYFTNCIQIASKEKAKLYNHKKNQFFVEINYDSLFSKNEDNGYESEFLSCIIKTPRLNYLMNHLLVTTFLALKWEKFKWLVYVNLALYSMAYTLLLFYGFVFSMSSQISHILLLTSLVFLLLGETIQIFIFRLDYFKRVENAIHLTFIGIVLFIIAAFWIANLNQKSLELIAGSVIFLISTLGIFAQLKNVSFFTIKVLMLQQIAVNFFKYMAFYIFPILAFFFCFFMLGRNSNNNANETYRFFTILYSTITMFAGDPKDDFPVEKFKNTKIFGSLIYLVFIVLIGIILHNLLIGLAISDLQDIQRQAEFIDKKEKSKYILNIEKLLFKKCQCSTAFNTFFQRLLGFCKIFEEDRKLVIHYCNSTWFFVRRYNGRKKIRDPNICQNLQSIFECDSIQDESFCRMYSLKNLYDKIQELETAVDTLRNENLEKIEEFKNCVRKSLNDLKKQQNRY